MSSLLFIFLLPLLTTLPTLARLRAARAAQRRGLVRAGGWRWLLMGLAAAQAAVWFTHLSLVYPTRLEPPLLGLASAGLMVLAARAARPHTHPGLRGLQRPLPLDGLDLIDREQRAALPADWRGLAARFRPVLPLLPALLVIAWLVVQVPARLGGLGLLAVLLAAPLLLVPYRGQWLLPLALALPFGFLLARAWTLAPTLPAGWWSQPMAASACPGLVRVIGHPPRAWCLELGAGRATAYHPGLGAVTLRQSVPLAARLFAAGGPFAWVQQNPARGLVRVGPGGPQPVPVPSAQVGAADPDGRLWVIDVGQEVIIYALDGSEQRLRAADGLLNNTANVVRVSPGGDVWVGSLGGLSVLRRGAATWRTYDRGAGVPGAVQALAFGNDGTVWLLWQAPPHAALFQDWGVSALTPNGMWTHRNIGAELQLELLVVEDPLAIDGLGRAWIASLIVYPPQRLLILAPPGQPAQRYSLGHYAPTHSLWRDPFGVAPDGAGGIWLYEGDEGWWHWRR